MRFLAVLFAWLILFTTMLLGVTTFVDPRGEFGNTHFPKVTLDARRQKLALFQEYQRAAPVQGLILGSSRSMKIDPALLTQASGINYFNFSVDAARPEGYLALYRWARAQGAPIQRVLIGLDIEALHQDDVMFVNMRNNAPLRQMIEQRDARWVRLDSDLSRLKGLLTADYLRDAARVALAASRPDARIPFMQFTANGYLHYPGREARRGAGTFDLQAEVDACLPGYLNIYGGMRELSHLRLGYLETLIREVQASGGEVEVWITPLHPQTARVLSGPTHYENLKTQTWAALLDLHERTSVKIADFSSPAQFGGSDTTWFDCAHIDTQGADQLVHTLLQLN